MSVRDRLARDVAVYLEPGEQIQATLMAMSGDQEYNDRAIVATDRRYLLCSLNFLGHINEHLADADRRVPLGPAHGGFQFWTESLGPTLGIHRRFFKDVTASDAALHSGTALSLSEVPRPRSGPFVKEPLPAQPTRQQIRDQVLVWDPTPETSPPLDQLRRAVRSLRLRTIQLFAAAAAVAAATGAEFNYLSNNEHLPDYGLTTLGGCAALGLIGLAIAARFALTQSRLVLTAAVTADEEGHTGQRWRVHHRAHAVLRRSTSTVVVLVALLFSLGIQGEDMWPAGVTGTVFWQHLAYQATAWLACVGLLIVLLSNPSRLVRYQP